MRKVDSVIVSNQAIQFQIQEVLNKLDALQSAPQPSAAAAPVAALEVHLDLPVTTEEDLVQLNDRLGRDGDYRSKMVSLIWNSSY